MKRILPFLFLGAIVTLTPFSFSQKKKCMTMEVMEFRAKNDVKIIDNYHHAESKINNWTSSNYNHLKKRSVVTIPVVVHVLYHENIENVSNNQIQSQIDRLNLDFRLLNSDSLLDDHPYWTFTADTQIEFCLANIDPQGNPTNGITRTYTDSTAFSALGYEKFSEYGGKDNWDPTKYLNIWVCNLDNTDGTLGYAAFPSDLAEYPEFDGVVIRYEAFGSVGTAGSGLFTGNDMGRTATHEVGHWLFLRHIWGDNQPNCGDDLVSDTKGAYEPNYGLPTFPLKPFNGCGSGEFGEMFMNYMDYPDDAALVMFTYEQALRMHASINEYRSGLKTSNGCQGISNITELKDVKFSVQPNPSSGKFTVQFLNENSNSIVITNIIGEEICKFENINNINNTLDLSSFLDGIYYINVLNNSKAETKKIILIK